MNLDGDVAAVGRITAIVRTVDPVLDEVLVRAAVFRAAPSRWARTELARELAAQPKLLTSGRPGRSAVIGRLIDQLVAAGSVTVSRPHCRLCRRIEDLPLALAGGGRACAACRDRLLAEPCPRCGSWRRLRRRSDGARVCLGCDRRRRAAVATPCPGCGSRRPLSYERDDGLRVCWSCGQRELAEWTRGWVAHFRRTAGTDDETRISEIVAAVALSDPDLPEQVVRAALARVAPSPRARSRIAREVAGRPEVLGSGLPDISPRVQELITELLAAGSRGVRRPSCTWCRRVRHLPKPLPGGGRLCGPCQARFEADRCPGCQEWRRLYGSRPDGTRVCKACRGPNSVRWEPCTRCGRRRPVARRTGEAPYCGRCLPALEKLPCTGCGRTDVGRRRHAGVMLCQRCAVAPARVCASCRLTRTRIDPDPGCPRCSSTDSLPCPACGDTWFAFGAGLRGCYRCRLLRRISRVVDGADPERVDQLEPFLTGLRRSINPRRGLDWLYRDRASQQLLADLLTGRSPVSHSTLDAVNSTRSRRSTSVEHLRDLLVASSVLPPRDEPLHRLEVSVDRLLGTADPADRGVLGQWAWWHVVAGVRRRVEAGQPSAAAFGPARSMLTEVDEFLRWLRRRGIPLGALGQAEVDRWAEAHPDQTAELSAFLRWAGRRRHIPRGVRPPDRPPRAVRLFSGQEQLYAVARRCLADLAIPSGHRLALGLVVLYGQPLSRICRLITTDLHLADDGSATLDLGRTPLALLPPLADAARTLTGTAAHDAVRTGIGTGFTTTPIWLFPGLPVTRYLGPAALADRIHPLLPGNVRGHRNTALLTLARDVPSVVLADLLGLHPGTVERWRDLAGASSAAYVAARLANGAVAKTV